MHKPGLAVALIASFASSPALADDEPATVGSEVIQVRGDSPPIDTTSTGQTIVMTRSYRTVSQGWMILPDGWEFGSELRFITSQPSLGATPLAFTDLSLLTLRGRRVLGKRADVFGSLDVLPKQPSYTDERVWQGATLGLNWQPWDRPLALWTRASAGPMLDGLGWWGQAATGAEARKVVHEIMTFEGGASVATTQLLPDAGSPAWLVEASLGGSILFHDPKNWTGAWIGVGYAVPLLHRGADPASMLALDPQPRLDVGLGAVLSFAPHWDVFARLAIIDRGDMGAMATRLPILDGGFDQRQIILGLTYRTKPRTVED